MAEFTATADVMKNAPGETIDFSEETTEDRINFLRSRGITVETPADRAKEKKVLETLGKLKIGDPGTKSFKYVYIPADETKSMVETDAVVTETQWRSGRDQFPLLLKSNFAEGTIDEVALRTTAQQHLVGSANAGEAAAKITPAALSSQGGEVEVVKLGENVNLYIDAVGALKNLPKNKRASALAARCGLGDVPLMGDMFVGRYEGRNVDFLLKDLEPETPWLRNAPTYNFKKQAENQANGLAPAGMDAEEINNKGGEGDGYKWSQTPEDIEIVVPLPTSGTRARDCKITFARRSLKVSIKGGKDIIFNPLFGEIHSDDSTWTVSDGNLVITMEKANEGMVWGAIS